MSMRMGVTCVSALYSIWLNWSHHSRRFNKICLREFFFYFIIIYFIIFIQFIVMYTRLSVVKDIKNYYTIAFLTHSHKLHPPNRFCQ